MSAWRVFLFFHVLIEILCYLLSYIFVSLFFFSWVMRMWYVPWDTLGAEEFHVMSKISHLSKKMYCMQYQTLCLLQCLLLFLLPCYSRNGRYCAHQYTSWQRDLFLQDAISDTVRSTLSVWQRNLFYWTQHSILFAVHFLATWSIVKGMSIFLYPILEGYQGYRRLPEVVKISRYLEYRRIWYPVHQSSHGCYALLTLPSTPFAFFQCRKCLAWLLHNGFSRSLLLFFFFCRISFHHFVPWWFFPCFFVVVFFLYYEFTLASVPVCLLWVRPPCSLIGSIAGHLLCGDVLTPFVGSIDVSVKPIKSGARTLRSGTVG